MSETDSVVYEETGALARVRLNRPRKRNALTSSMLERLAEIFEGITKRGDVRVVILSGAGEAFCAGTDISELESMDETGARRKAKRGQEVCNLIERCAVPVIAEVGGIAAGGGCELALSCHLRVATRSASFSLPETKLGLIPGYGGTQRLARIAGHGRALEMMLAGKILTAEEALRTGLVNRISEPAQLPAETETLAREIEALAPLAIRACLTAVTRGQDLPLAEGLALEADLFSRLFSTADMREGTRAFLEKRPPVFQGK